MKLDQKIKLTAEDFLNPINLVKEHNDDPLNPEFTEDNVHTYINVYAVIDMETGIYDTPFFTRGDIFAKRKFIMDIRNKAYTMLSQFSDNFSLIRLAKFNVKTGEFIQDVHVMMNGKEVPKDEKRNEA